HWGATGKTPAARAEHGTRNTRPKPFPESSVNCRVRVATSSFNLTRVGTREQRIEKKGLAMKTLLKTVSVVLAVVLAAVLCPPPQARGAEPASGNTVQPLPAYPL